MSDIKTDGVSNSLNLLASGSVGRLLWQYSLPSVVGLLVMSLYNVVDRIFIGRGVGTEAISGLAITFPVMNLTTALGVLVGAGATARISICLGRKDMRSASEADQRHCLYKHFRTVYRPDPQGFRSQ